ncbi:hypothetical protein AXF11_07060 [Leptotrichia sp. oral taxon 847]|nr:hypothetical protein AXF11_07060 [Leptotrichia sp. oral taxon 847]
MLVFLLFRVRNNIENKKIFYFYLNIFKFMVKYFVIKKSTNYLIPYVIDVFVLIDKFRKDVRLWKKYWSAKI